MALTPNAQATTALAPAYILDLAADAMAERPAEARRIAAAVHLVLDGHVRPSLSGVPLWYVRSQTTNLTYIIQRAVAAGRAVWSCTCPDHQQRARACKHILAARLYRKLYQPDGGGPSAPATARHVAVPAVAASADTRADGALDARVWLTPRGAAEAAKLPSLWELLTRDFQRVDAALWRHHARTGHSVYDCPAMRRADALWQELARALDLELQRQHTSAA